ncbi:TonB-dependent receptor [Pyrinomonas methylaliphatogenes]|uniref:Carboxypeptidase regulatory-like domain n=1 Tax=Pyrinomonas methylaliphatogenes TaxID=454194 RepID=A0A0B6X194_9BACT|nr:carboxypeptidase-like regulatory domain-containing protein [Pyrinomonas methylaliphatogenes]CDM66767.1 Carboxypeptidase regulatory-like domain [Pyrinomonas methylaliphatogenes]
MRHLACKLALLVFYSLTCSALVSGQVISTGSLSGAVVDQAGAVVAGATVTVRNNETGAEYTAQTADNGTFIVPSLPVGTYTVTVTMQGFKQAILQDVKIDVGKVSSVNVSLEPGQINESVTITGAGGELLQTQSTNIATTITGRQITELPFTSRDSLDLVLLLPGTVQVGRPRASSVNGLPKGTLNITIDGINVQDNYLKSSDGFFTYIRPRIDAIEEVTLSTATPGAESAGEGAVQIKFVTRAGTNDFRGSLYWYHRNPALNANYWFNNRDLPPDPVDGKAPRNRVLLNQFGGRLGGPIIHNRAFFFVNYEEFRLPERNLRERTILSPQAEQGIFQYITSGGVRSVNLLAVAAATNCNPAGANATPFTPCTSTIDPTIGPLLAAIRSSTSAGGVRPLTDPNFQAFSFINSGLQKRRFPTVRFDLNLTEKHHLENIYNYQKFDSTVDFLNNVDPAFPGFPNFGSQKSNRFSNVTAWRATFSPRLVNEARFGFTGGTTLFFPEVNSGQFQNQGGLSFGTAVGTGGFAAAAGISNPTVTNSPSRRNTPIWQFTDNLTYIHGNHTFNIGGSFTQVNFWGQSFPGGVVPAISFGVDSSDPASRIFTSANFPGASADDLTRARGIYAVLVGRVTGVSGVAALDEKSGQYRYLGDYIQRARQRELGLYLQDAWRYRSNLTLNLGLRWEVQFPFTALNNNYSFATYDDLFGISGRGNLFRPGVLQGRPTQFVQFKPGDKPFATDYNNFAPSVGFAWSPDWKSGWLHRLFGSEGQSVIRAGYSIATVREGMNVVASILGANPGGTVNAARSLTLGNLTPGTLLRDRASIAPPSFPSAPSYPITGTVSDSVNAFDPNLKLGYVQSWTFGIQREITKDMVIEARYVGTRGVKLWRQYNLNEINVVENGFLNEFRRAQANLQANIAAGRGNTFAYTGVPGTSPLPIMLAYFSGIPAAQANDPSRYTSALFSNSTFLNLLAINNPSPQGFANTILSTASLRANGINAGLPANFFVVNPDKLGGAFLVDNGGHSWYDGLTIELRRRLSQGLLLQASYTWSKALTDMYDVSSVVFSQYPTLRQTNLAKSLSPFDVRHAFKANWIYELPFGRGRAFFGDAGSFLDSLIGGWSVHGTARVQSGTPFRFQNVRLVNMTVDELQKFVEVRKDPNKIVYYLDPDVILNTRRAFNVTPTGYSALGAPTGKYIAPAGGPDCIPAYAGQCGFANLVLHGPRFVRLDMSVVKRIKLTETANFELRGEFLNAINNVNFRIGGWTADSVTVTGLGGATFGQLGGGTAYQDLSTTNDPGGRLVQIVLRLNF